MVASEDASGLSACWHPSFNHYNNHMPMKKLFALAALVTVTIILAIVRTPDAENPNEPAAHPGTDEVSQLVEVPAAIVPAPPATQPVASPASAPLDTKKQWLNQLYESPSLVERLKAARQIAALGDKSAFLDLATFVAAAEATGEGALADVAAQVAAILGQMGGTEIQAVATELAYSPSPLVAGAAVDAAVMADSGAVPQSFDLGLALNPADQDALDSSVQLILDYDGQSASDPVAHNPHNE